MAIYKNIGGTAELFGDISGDGTLEAKRVTSSNYSFVPVSSSISSVQNEYIYRYDKITAMQIVMYTTHLVEFSSGWNTLAKCAFTNNSQDEYALAIQPKAALLGSNGIGFYEFTCLSGSELFDAGAFVIPHYREIMVDQQNDSMEIRMYCNDDISIDKGSGAYALYFNAMFFNKIR